MWRRIKKIKQIKLEAKTFLDEEIQYYLDDFLYLSEIQKIVLDRFNVDDKLIEIINSLKNLENIEFSHCTFNSMERIKNKIKVLTITYCKNINFNIIISKDTVTELRIYEFDKNVLSIEFILEYVNIQKLSIFNATIKNSNKLKNFANLKALNIDGSNLDIDNLSDLLRSGIKVSHKKYYFLV